MICTLREAETLFDSERRRDKDVGLSERGKRMYMYLNASFDVVLCSPLSRAVESLSMSRIEFEKKVIVNHLREIKDDNPVNYFTNEDILPETPDEIDLRLKRVKDILSSYQGKKVLILSHYSFLQRLTGLSHEAMQIHEIKLL